MPYNIKIKEGDLLDEENATFIVNASNTKMILGSGVSMAFRKHCGYEMQELMFQELQKRGKPLERGDILCTTSAKCKNFKYAIHAAVMNYNKGVRFDKQKPTIKIIEKILFNIENCLKDYAKKHKEKIKLVLPLLGCGVGGLDKSEVIKTYFTFFSRNVDFDCEVVIYGYSKDDFELLIKIYNLFKKDG